MVLPSALVRPEELEVFKTGWEKTTAFEQLQNLFKRRNLEAMIGSVTCSTPMVLLAYWLAIFITRVNGQPEHLALLLAAIILTSCSPFTGRYGYVQWSKVAAAIKEYLTGGRFQKPGESASTAAKELYKQKMSSGVAALASPVQLPDGLVQQVQQRVVAHYQHLIRCPHPPGLCPDVLKGRVECQEATEARKLLDELLGSERPSQGPGEGHTAPAQAASSKPKRKASQKKTQCARDEAPVEANSYSNPGSCGTLTYAQKRVVRMRFDTEVRNAVLQAIPTCREPRSSIRKQVTAYIQNYCPASCGKSLLLQECERKLQLVDKLHQVVSNPGLVTHDRYQEFEILLAELSGIAALSTANIVEQAEVLGKGVSGTVIKARYGYQEVAVKELIILVKDTETGRQLCTLPKSWGKQRKQPLEAVTEAVMFGDTARTACRGVLKPLGFWLQEYERDEHTVLAVRFAMPAGGLSLLEAKVKLLVLAEEAELTKDQIHTFLLFATMTFISMMAQILADVHSLGRLHRDIKLENVLLKGAESVVTVWQLLELFSSIDNYALIDWGLATAARRSGPDTAHFSLLRATLCTPVMKAPEFDNVQCRKVVMIDSAQKIDIWCMGLSALSMLYLGEAATPIPDERVNIFKQLPLTLDSRARNIEMLQLVKRNYCAFQQDENLQAVLALIEACISIQPKDRPSAAALPTLGGYNFTSAITQLKEQVLSWKE